MSEDNEIKQFQLDLEKQYQDHLSKYAHSWSNERLPLYVDKANYNTNAPSYYDYLARMLNYMLGQLEYAVNRTLRRNIKFTDTFSIDFDKIGDWVDNGKCLPNNFDDVIDVSAVVNISEQTETIDFKYLKLKEFVVKNGSKIKPDGVWSPDYIDVLRQLDLEINDINKDIDNINNQINEINQAITNINNQITDIYNKIGDIVVPDYSIRVEKRIFNNDKGVGPGIITFEEDITDFDYLKIIYSELDSYSSTDVSVSRLQNIGSQKITTTGYSLRSTANMSLDTVNVKFINKRSIELSNYANLTTSITIAEPPTLDNMLGRVGVQKNDMSILIHDIFGVKYVKSN